MRICIFLILVLFSTSFVFAESMTWRPYSLEPTDIYKTMKSQKLSLAEFYINQAAEVQSNNLQVRNKRGVVGVKSTLQTHNITFQFAYPRDLARSPIVDPEGLETLNVLMVKVREDEELRSLNNLIAPEISAGTRCGLSRTSPQLGTVTGIFCMGKEVTKDTCPLGYKFHNFQDNLNTCVKQ